MQVKELISFLSKQNPDAKVTLTKSDCHEYTNSNGYIEAYYDDSVTDLEPHCLTVDILGNGDVDIRWL